MRLVGKDKEPLDLSKEKHAEIFKKSMEKWQKGMENNSDGSKFGYIDIEGIDLPAYGTPYPA